ncbi:hypothetical protein BDV93DRAFT_520618 [Ceratobasidium sp. AG-I]|nr:hypothetical protein BDV93DRAFT_520618 [Ceratobasidium sp. AG-I]
MSTLPSLSSISNRQVTSTTSPPHTSELPILNAATPKPPKLAETASNGGTVSERPQQTKQAETEKQRNEEAALKKRAFADRFKNRGKRPRPDEDAKKDEATSSKKIKSDKELSQYEKEVKQYKGRSLKDDGMGVRPLVK